MNEMSLTKVNYPLTNNVNEFLKGNDRVVELPIDYNSLLRYRDAFPIGDSLWSSVLYSSSEFDDINAGLCYIYSLLKTEGDVAVVDHLRVDRIDLCMFGNSNPFRIRIINYFNDNYDYFYVKRTDISRIFGLELEDISSPNKINFLVDKDTLIEEHISGIPGDDFIKTKLEYSLTNKSRVAKEFVKFNERCFYTLLGDMRAYNYVIEITHDFEDMQYRIRSIDFDQQCYEGKKNLYLPQFYRENLPFVELVMEKLNEKTINQYKAEERSSIVRRIKHSRKLFKKLFDTMEREILSTPEKLEQLKLGLAKHHNNDSFLECKSMASVCRKNLLTLIKQPELLEKVK
jgi:hypothetical protein